VSGKASLSEGRSELKQASGLERGLVLEWESRQALESVSALALG
jgi:hypothetical protein